MCIWYQYRSFFSVRAAGYKLLSDPVFPEKIWPDFFCINRNALRVRILEQIFRQLRRETVEFFVDFKVAQR